MPDTRGVEVIVNIVSDRYNAGTDEEEGKLRSTRFMMSFEDWRTLEDIRDLIAARLGEAK